MEFKQLTKEEAKVQIRNKVAEYLKLKEQGRIIKNDEEQIKQHFLEPLFEYLGWNIHHIDEVKKEENVGRKEVDYAFKINGVIKFLLEAKAYNLDLDNNKWLEQTLNYGWNKGVTWAVLSNFEKLYILNSDWKITGNFLMSSYKCLNLNKYGDEQFEDLWLLSKEAFLANKLDEKAEREEKRDKRTPVTKQLFKDLTTIRDLLKKNIIKNNDSFKDSPELVEEIIQRIIDKLIFIRKTEDLEIENSHLKSALHLYKSGEIKNLCDHIQKLFIEYDKNYNSEMFKSNHPSNTIKLSNEVLVTTINTLYSPDSRYRYNFADIESDVLGNIYEQYLSLVIKGGTIRGKHEINAAHKKEQGIYYTPTYVVDYIVKNTIGEWIKNKHNDITKIKVLDPACGSGSFLIKAVDYLYYEKIKKDGKEYQSKLDSSSKFRTTLKSEIVQNNIYGVDLDEKAIDVAQLNLLLKIAENKQKLPALRDNIKVGDSLIDEPTIAENKSFDWKEKFKEIMSTDGFDVVIGNPPYVRPHNLKQKNKQFLWKRFKTFKAKSDLYNCFMEKGINLTKEDGFFSFIVPHTWTSLESFYEIRKYILDSCKIVKLVQLPKKVFQDATVETCIFVLSKEKDKNKREKNKIIVEKLNEKGDVSFIKEFEQSQIRNNHLYNFELYSEKLGNELLNKIKNKGTRLGDVINFFYGLKTGDDKKFIFNTQKNKDCKKLLRSKDVGKYSKEFKGKYVWYVPNLMIKNKKTARPADKERFETEKIIIARMGKRVLSCYDDENYYVKDGMLLLKKSEKINLRYITGILNSKLINYYYKNYFITIDVLKNALLELPIIFPDENTILSISKIVDKIEKLNKEFIKLKNINVDKKEELEKEINELEKEIDELIYKIYGIIDSEKEIIEKSLS